MEQVREQLVEIARAYWSAVFPEMVSRSSAPEFEALLDTSASNAVSLAEILREGGADPHDAVEVAFCEWILLEDVWHRKHGGSAFEPQPSARTATGTD